MRLEFTFSWGTVRAKAKSSESSLLSGYYADTVCKKHD